MLEGIFNYILSFPQAVEVALANPSPVLGTLGLFWFLTTHGLWILWLYFAFQLFLYWWMNRIQGAFSAKRQWVMLAIDVPRDNIQSPKAVENIFSHLAGAHSNPDYEDQYWKGKTQDYFSFEIVGIEGGVQFIIRTPVTYRDLVESSIYAQYPEAQITEIEDYTTGFPDNFPNDRYEMYGTEFVLANKNQLLPIRTYVEFEHQMSQEFKDPLTTLLETLNKLGPGEQVWLQLIIVPTDEGWKKPASSEIKKIMGQAPKKGPGIVGGVISQLGSIGAEAQRQALGLEPAKAKDKEKPTFLLMAPDDEARVKGIAMKIKKIGFLVKFRFIYIAQKEKFVGAHGAQSIVGVIKQFNTGDLNALKPDTKKVGVHAHYIFVDQKKNARRTKLMRWYKSRDWYSGNSTYVLNTEELASLWHFPLKTETMPIRHMVQRTEFKHTPPPNRLPTVDALERAPSKPKPSPEPVQEQAPTAEEADKPPARPEATPPGNLPIA